MFVIHRREISELFRGLGKAFFCSMDGWAYLLAERPFRQELALGVFLVVFEMFKQSSGFARLYLFSSYMLVLISEGFNSAIESTVDRIGKEKHELSKKAKDIGSFVVLLSLVHLGIVFCFIVLFL
ncbi:MAG: diacylglycerol kinase [Holosporaceae bacterium]|jgi:diacylglycerol kinase (ATP)|nr:diacylglycerol kinase [Holosporaceae bacterium]